MLVTVRSERGATLILVLALAAIASLLAMSLLFTTDVDFRTSKNYQDQTESLSNTDSAISEVLWRMNLATGMSALPGGSEIDVNSLTKYEAMIDYDPFDLLTNGTDDDGDGDRDEPDELNLTYEWTTLITQSTTEPNPGSPWEVTDSDLTTGPPYGSKFVEATIQPQTTWRPYSVADQDSDQVLSVRFKLDTDTAVGDSEGDGPEIVFYDPAIVTRPRDDENSLNGLGGDGDAVGDSPYNITWSDGTTTYPASGNPVFLVRATGRVEQRAETIATREIEAELYHKRTVRHIYGKAICACTSLKLGGPTDSYKSSEGTYGSGPIYDNGDIGSNGDIDLSGGGLVSGNSESGTDTKLSGVIGKDAWAGTDIVTIAEVNGTAYPWHTPVPAPCHCDAYDLPALMAAAQASNDNATGMLPGYGDAYDYGKCTVRKKSTFPVKSDPNHMIIPSNASVILTGGTYYLTNLKVSEELQVGLDTDGDCIVDAPPTEPVKIYVDGRIAGNGDVDLASNGIVNGSNKPEDLQVFIYSLDKAFTISSSFIFRGTVYHPNFQCNVSGGATIEGALVCDEFNGGGAGVHYDEDLHDAIIVEQDEGIRLLAWRELD